jgi:hypothetical protein
MIQRGPGVAAAKRAFEARRGRFLELLWHRLRFPGPQPNHSSRLDRRAARGSLWVSLKRA